MAKDWVPRRFGEHKRHKHLRRLMDSNLMAGDVLLVKEWSNSDDDVEFIRTSQAVFSHMRGGSSNTEHVILNCEDGSVYAIESLGNGINIGNKIRRRDHVVYSCFDQALRWEAVYVAQRLAGVGQIQAPVHETDTPELVEAKTWNARASHDPTIKYRSGTGMAASVFRSKKQGKRAHARIEQLYRIVYEGQSAQGIRMICSEFVASCYEVAALKIERATGTNPEPFGVGIDPRAMTAKSLEAMLVRPNNKFLMTGSYCGSEPLSPLDLTLVRQCAALYVEYCKAAQRDLSVEDAYTAIEADRARWIINKLTVQNRDYWSRQIAKAYDQNLLTTRAPPPAAPGKARSSR